MRRVHNKRVGSGKCCPNKKPQGYGNQGLNSTISLHVFSITFYILMLICMFRFNRLLPIYILPDQRRDIQGSFKWLRKMSKIETSFMFYDLIYLFQQFLLASPFDVPNRITYGACEAHLTRDVYLYLANVSCR